MKKLNNNGFAHFVLPLLVVIAVIGGIGSYVLLNKSDAATLTAAQKCRNNGGVYFNANVTTHGACWASPGAYLLDQATGKYSYQPASVARGQQTAKVSQPDYLIVVSGSWKVCDDKVLADVCTYISGSGTPYKKGLHSLKQSVGSYQKHSGSVEYMQYNYSTKSDVYAERL